MRAVFVVVAVLCSLSCVPALPATSKQIDDGIEFVSPKQTYGDQPIIDTGVVGFDESPFYNPFGGLFENLENLVVRVRQQMNDLLSQFPGIRGGNSSAELPVFPALEGFPQIDLDLGKGNTTSVTKIIDGHKVIINQTEYQKDDELGSAFFKVRIINVEPQDAETEKDSEEVTPDSVIPKDRESLENTLENEIIKNKEAIPYQPSTPNFIRRFVPAEWSAFNQIPPIYDNSLNFEPIRDLSRDTYVNELLANSGATVNPDAEIFEVLPQGGAMGKFQYPRNPR